MFGEFNNLLIKLNIVNVQIFIFIRCIKIPIVYFVLSRSVVKCHLMDVFLRSQVKVVDIHRYVFANEFKETKDQKCEQKNW